MTPRNLTILVFSIAVSILCYEKAETNRFAMPIGESIRLVERHYVEHVDTRQLFEAAMAGIVSSLGDPYSEYIPPNRKQRFDESLEGEFGGVGIVVDPDPKNHCLTVLSPMYGEPAFRAGIRAGDSILEIDGQSTDGLAMNDAVRLMRGKTGTQVQLKIMHRDETESQLITLTRAIIKIPSVLGDLRRADGSWDFFLEENPRVQYIRILTFGEHTSAELAAALSSKNAKGQSAEAIILDVRNNAGGLLKSAIETCDMFLDAGVIVSTRGRDGIGGDEYHARAGTTVNDNVPIAVLVNGYSASAAEILAACLQDHDRATVIGQRTWGKGTVQNVIPLEGNRSALRLTTATYWRPSGRNIHRSKSAKEDDEWGVRPTPQFDVPLEPDLAKKVSRFRRFRDVFHVGEDDDPYLDDSGSENAVSGPPEPVDDPQLRRAIDLLQEKLRTPQAA